MDLYKVLDVRKNASVKTIKKAYHEKVLKHHPDKNPKADIHKFHEILAAYEISGGSRRKLSPQLGGSLAEAFPRRAVLLTVSHGRKPAEAGGSFGWKLGGSQQLHT